MGCRLRIFLTQEEKATLDELRKAALVPQRTKDRAFVLLLNARGWKNAQIAEIFNWAEKTVRQTIHRWQSKGLVGLWDTSGRGVKPKWQEADLVHLEQSLEQEQRTYNSRQLTEKLRRDLRFAAALRYRQIHLSPDRIRPVLKKRGGFGNVPEAATVTSTISKKKP
jgi:transposase